MKDFTLEMYKEYLLAIKQNYSSILRFDEFMDNIEHHESFCLIRHDVDRKVDNAINMAHLEADMGIKSTYYFRKKSSVYKKTAVREIHDLGHEIGYHYENLSESKGNFDLAYEDFKFQLMEMREITPVRTISMHGKPLSKYDNRDMWKYDAAQNDLKTKYGISGEIYLHLDYTDIAYIGDTGRNWNSDKSNKRDHVNSTISVNFNSGRELLKYLKEEAPKKLVFQIHPERWSSNSFDYATQFIKDSAINLIKKIL